MAAIFGFMLLLCQTLAREFRKHSAALLRMSLLHCYEDCVSLLDDSSLVQMIAEPTRDTNVFEFLTSNLPRINSVLNSLTRYDANLSHFEQAITQEITCIKIATALGFRASFA